MFSRILEGRLQVYSVFSAWPYDVLDMACGTSAEHTRSAHHVTNLFHHCTRVLCYHSRCERAVIRSQRLGCAHLEEGAKRDSSSVPDLFCDDLKRLALQLDWVHRHMVVLEIRMLRWNKIPCWLWTTAPRDGSFVRVSTIVSKSRTFSGTFITFEQIKVFNVIRSDDLLKYVFFLRVELPLDVRGERVSRRQVPRQWRTSTVSFQANYV